MLANSMINRGGPTFLTRLLDQTGATTTDIAQCFVAARNSFDLTDLNTEIDQLDTKIDGALQIELYCRVQDLLLQRVIWFKRNVSFEKGISAVVERFRGGITALRGKLTDAVNEEQNGELSAIRDRYMEAGVPEPLAHRLAWLQAETAIPDIVMVAEETDADLTAAAKAFFDVAAFFSIDSMHQLAGSFDIRD